MYQRILVPVDGSVTSQLGLEKAIGVATLTGGSIRLLHVIDELAHLTGFETPEVYTREIRPRLWRHGQQVLDNARAAVEAAGVPVEVELAESLAARVADIVVARAETCKADLIVMGTNGYRGATRILLGSDAEQVVRTANVPVLLVRAPQASAAASGGARSG